MSVPKPSKEATKPPPSEEEMLANLRAGEMCFPPFTIDARLGERTMGKGASLEVDAIAALHWREREYHFAVETKVSTTPKSFNVAQDAAERGAQALGLRPMLLVPYLSPEQLERLETRGISGLDLCGNGIVVVPGEMFVLRTGSPNRFRTEGRIKKPYSKNSSIVARVFLLRPEFESIGAVRDEIHARGGTLSLGTVSKVVDALEEDLVVERGTGQSWRSRSLRLLQPEKLLDLLRDNYRPPDVRGEFLGKLTVSADVFWTALGDWRREQGGRIVHTGVGCVAVYAVMAREDLAEIYCSDLSKLLRHVEGSVRETERFPNLRLLEARDDFVYFDGRPEFLASPIQTYLELAAGDKRDRETAEQVRRRILAGLPNSSLAKDANGPSQDESGRPPA